MKIFLHSISEIARVFASGKTIWCPETGEGFAIDGGCSIRAARNHILKLRYYDSNRKTFFYVIP